MKFNPITNTLYTNDNKLIKKMHCPYSALQWNDLSEIEGSNNKFCDICTSSVVETDNMSDEALWTLLQDDPDTCLKVDWNQKNVQIVHHG